MPMASGIIDIQGTCDSRFAAVRDVFAGNFADLGEVGAGVAVTLDGRLVVDLWGGHADAARTRPWRPDTVVNVYSSTKGITSTAAAILAGRGQLDYDAPVTRYWPEFGPAGKDGVLVRHLFTHRVGLPYLADVSTLSVVFDWAAAVRVLEAQPPLWTPGAQSGYHAFTFGWLTGEVIRRITGMSVGAFVRAEIAGPLGVDFSIGTPATEAHRIAEVLVATRSADQPRPGADVLPKYALDLHEQAIASVNTPQFRLAELPAANGHSNARSLARIYGVLANEGRDGDKQLVDAAAVAQLSVEASSGYDVVLARDVRRSLGFNLAMPGGLTGYGPNPRTFGHGGAGGSLGFADPDARIGFGYAMNRMRVDRDGDPRWLRLIDAVYSAI
jgi:CubicO group peptidase (beta-lactamase class C family)